MKGQGSGKEGRDNEKRILKEERETLKERVLRRGGGDRSGECCAICGEACTDFVISNLTYGLALEVQAHGLLITKVLEQLYWNAVL